MNKPLGVLASVLMLMIGLGAGAVMAQTEPGPPPEIDLIVSFQGGTVIDGERVYYPPDPITVDLTVFNNGVTEIMREGWPDMEFWLLLQFFDEKGRLITSDVIRESSTLSPRAPVVPPVFPDSDGRLIQGTRVEEVPPGEVASYGFNAYDYYPLEGRSGRFRLLFKAPYITFLAFQQTGTGTKYAPPIPLIRSSPPAYSSPRQSPEYSWGMRMATGITIRWHMEQIARSTATIAIQT